MDPYLLIGPFHIEIENYSPLRSIFHDFFTEGEIDWMILYSLPRLSTARRIESDRNRKAFERYGDARAGYSVRKTVQAWITDITYNEQEIIHLANMDNADPVYEVVPLNEPYSFTIKNEKLFDISVRIGLATKLNLTTRYGSSRYQTTNYGLGGLVETHVDPWGYEQGTRLPEERKHLVTRGDYIATFMGWLQDVQLGGGTGFPSKGFQGRILPRKGSAAFWVNLLSCHRKDARSLHGGCPVLKGSKWIVNKWVYSWDQWKRWPCHTKKFETIEPFSGMSSFDYG